jgi:hypothetical protein
MKINPNQEDLDNLADILWFIKGYVLAKKEEDTESIFTKSHLETLQLARNVLGDLTEKMKDELERGRKEL